MTPEEAITRCETLKREIEQEVQCAQGILYGTPLYDEKYSGQMAAAVAHSNIALVRRGELDVLLPICRRLARRRLT